MWPDWYNRQQPDFQYELESIFDGTISVRPIKDMNLKPRVLCHTCNHGWGSDLEKRIEPILTPMIRGKAQQLDKRATELLSAWFFLKVMVSEYLIPSGVRDRRFFSPADGHHLKATLRPPNGILIWIGQYVGSRSNAGWVTDRSSAQQISDDPPAGIFWHTVTYSIGQVLLHLFAASQPGLLRPPGDHKEPVRVEGQMALAPGNWKTGLTPIWQTPSAPISWPPEKAFDDNGFIYLADRWNPKETPSVESPPEISNAGDEGAST